MSERMFTGSPENRQEGADQGKLDALWLSWGEALFNKFHGADVDDSGVRDDLMNRVQSDPDMNPATKEAAMEILGGGSSRTAIAAWQEHLSSLRTPEQKASDASEARRKEAEQNRISESIMLESAAKRRADNSEDGGKTYLTKNGVVKGELLGPKTEDKWTIRTKKGDIDVERP